MRRVGETRLGGSALRATYVAAARGAAAAFGRIPGVTAVLGSGSITRPALLSPGSSDIDLLLVVDVPSLQSELDLARRIAKVHGVLHGAMPLFSNLDYVEGRDLDLLRVFGNAWSMDFDRRFLCLWGEDPRMVRPTVMPRAPEERRLEHAVFAVKSWTQACGVLLHPDSEPARKPRQLGRLVSNLLAAALDGDRFLPRAELLVEARARGIFPLASRLPHEGPLPLHAGLAAALELASYMVASVSSHWEAPFEVEAGAPVPEVGPEGRTFAALARRLGLGAVLVPRGPEGAGILAVAVAPRSDSPHDVVGRAERLFADVRPLRGAEFRWLRLPAVVPSSFIRTAALWGPAPLVGPALAGSARWLEGEPSDAPVTPSLIELRSLLRARILQQFVRRPARADRHPAAFAAELDFEAHALRPALAHAFDKGSFRLAFHAAQPAKQSPGARLEALREWLDGRRVTLSSDLGLRRCAPRKPP